MRKTYIAPSILSANFSKIGSELGKVTAAGADWIHCDVMDGVFVPNISFGPKFIKDMRSYSTLPFDVHLMIVDPERYIDVFADAGADYITIHLEACKDAAATLEKIKQRGVKCGAVISPDTPVSALSDYIKQCDLVLLMSVYPGFGGQKFIEKSWERITELKKLRDEKSPSTLIEIDGGITMQNAPEVIKRGVDVIVAGNTLFGAQDMQYAISKMRGDED